MLAALITNLQNTPSARPSWQRDAGKSTGERTTAPIYDTDAADILRAVQAFPEIAGEHPDVRAVRRLRYVNEYLRNRETQGRREGAAFLIGAAVAQSAAEETIRVKEEEIAKWIAAYDQLRTELAAKEEAAQRAKPSSVGLGAVLIGVTAGIVIGVAITRRRNRASRLR